MVMTGISASSTASAEKAHCVKRRYVGCMNKYFFVKGLLKNTKTSMVIFRINFGRVQIIDLTRRLDLK